MCEVGVSCLCQRTDPIAPGHYFLLGDNRDNSQDSRGWGPISEARIIGKLSRSYLPVTMHSLHSIVDELA
ncbi:MAG TPA: S26 family signal peptidase [Acidobacteriota bacterium]|nr:S26 family signal peptidase [Acidobacteriota bacterium]